MFLILVFLKFINIVLLFLEGIRGLAVLHGTKGTRRSNIHTVIMDPPLHQPSLSTRARNAANLIYHLLSLNKLSNLNVKLAEPKNSQPQAAGRSTGAVSAAGGGHNDGDYTDDENMGSSNRRVRRHGGRPRRGADGAPRRADAIETMVKPTLRLEREIDALNTTGYYNILVDAKFNLDIDGIDAAHHFSTRIRALPRGAPDRGEAGDVTWYVWASIITAFFSKDLKDTGPFSTAIVARIGTEQSAATAALQEHCTSTTNPVALSEVVHYCAIKRTFSSSTKRLQFADTPVGVDLAQALLQVLIALGKDHTKVCHGAAPRGALENQLANYIG